MDGTGREMNGGLSFGPQFGRLQGEVPHNLNALGSDGGGEGGRGEAVALDEMGREELIAYIRRHRL